jgi:hypothetical protein
MTEYAKGKQGHRKFPSVELTFLNSLGIGSLYLHRMSNTSSRKPRKVAIRRERREAKYADSFPSRQSETVHIHLRTRSEVYPTE